MSPTITYLELRTGASLSSIRVLNELLEVASRALGVDPSLQHDLALGVAELVANVVEHELEGSNGEVLVRLEHSGDQLVLTVSSSGPPFDLEAALAHAANHDPLAELQGSGLGLPLLVALFDKIEHDYDAELGNRISLRRAWAG